MQTTRWLVITIFDIITEIAIVGLPTYFLVDLQMNLNNKITAGGAFGFRLMYISVPFAIPSTNSLTST